MFNRIKTFNKAFNKAARLKAGQKSTLTLEEKEILLSFLYREALKETCCYKCGNPTLDKDRTHPAICAKGIRICGVCCWYALKRQEVNNGTNI